MYLYSISLPGNLEAECGRIRSTLFKNSGNLSVLSFPSIIPLLFTGIPPEEEIGRRLARREFVKPSLTSGRVTSGLLEEDGVLYSPLELPFWDELLSLIARTAARGAGSEKGSDFPVDILPFPGIFRRLRSGTIPEEGFLFRSPGLFMGYSEEGPERSILSENDLSLPEIRWKHGDMICMKMEWDESSPWWEGVVFSQL